MASAPLGRAFHYRDGDTPLHRLGPGWKLAAASLAGAAAIAAHGPLALGVLSALLLAGYRAAGLGPAALWQDARWLAFQGALVVALSALREGAPGLASGARTAAQIALFFLPGALLLRTTSSLALLGALRRLLPAQLAFALSTSLRFVPYFAREAHEIVAAQRLRGARLAPRELWRPSAWRDWVECVAVPLAVRAIQTAGEAALAADIRGLAQPGEPQEERP
jgi:energy-coupling factor transport system permease protein